MNFEEWEPAYEAILEAFGYDRTADEHTRDVLAEQTSPFELGRLDVLDGATVAIVGAGPSLPDDLDLVRSADSVLAASSAADVLLDAGVRVDCMVTDLDKNPETARELSAEGVPVAVHAHGDNVAAVHEYVPRFERDQILPTTQAAPRPPVENFGGFTDGDRAAFLADHFGAERLVFPGWVFDDPAVEVEKRRKLRWAARLLRWLEERRGAQFPVLDELRGELSSLW